MATSVSLFGSRRHGLNRTTTETTTQLPSTVRTHTYSLSQKCNDREGLERDSNPLPPISDLVPGRDGHREKFWTKRSSTLLRFMTRHFFLFPQ